MVTRMAQAEALSVRQKLAMFHGTAISAEQALKMNDSEITFNVWKENGVTALNLVTAELRPLTLKKFGVSDAQKLRRLGFDALHLVDPLFCKEANAAYGAEDVIDAFLTSPADAVALAGTEALTTLGVTMERLLESCAGAPTEALAVVQQDKSSEPLKGVGASVVLDTGLRAPQLKSLGINLIRATQQLNASNEEMAKFGYML